jgi:hypothetical protein
MKTKANLATDETRREHGERNFLIHIGSVSHSWLRVASAVSSGRPCGGDTARYTPWCLGVLLICLFALSAQAQTNYAIPWFKIGGGGAMQSTGGVYTLSGTIGQADAGRAAGGSYRSEGGFWGIAVQQAGFPPLSITPSGANALVSWGTIETGFILQSATDLGTPTAWTDSGLTPVVTTTNYVVTVPLNSAVKTFFRLRRP